MTWLTDYQYQVKRSRVEWKKEEEEKSKVEYEKAE